MNCVQPAFDFTLPPTSYSTPTAKKLGKAEFGSYSSLKTGSSFAAPAAWVDFTSAHKFVQLPSEPCADCANN